MKLIDTTHNVPNKPLVATIGFFDGVHAGHRYLIEQVRQEATRKGLNSAVVTFVEHPRQVLNADFQPALLCGYNEKIERLASTGVDYCCPIHFTTEIARMSAREFMQLVLKDRLSVDTLLIGYDHRFGRNREDSFEQYKDYGKQIGIDVILAKELDSESNVSSSAVRRLLAKGDMKQANQLLSYNYNISGKVVEGFKVGRTIGFPTANVQIWEQYKVVPALGVYAAHVYVQGKAYGGMLYIGNRPTLQNGGNVSIEINLFDFDADLYNQSITAELIEFVRHDRKFDNIEQLKQSIANDKIEVQKILENYKTD